MKKDKGGIREKKAFMSPKISKKDPNGKPLNLFSRTKRFLLKSHANGNKDQTVHFLCTQYKILKTLIKNVQALCTKRPDLIIKLRVQRFGLTLREHIMNESLKCF